MSQVLVLGNTGMLGSAVCEELKNAKIDFETAARNNESANYRLDAIKPEDSLIDWTSYEYVINCIGVIKPHINEKSSRSIKNSIEVNSIFPHRLGELAIDSKIIQIATDCVYSGVAGTYDENYPHDALDVYGKTKSLGEVHSKNFMNIRCSIIGPEVGKSTSLWEWVKNQPLNSEINGFVNHKWNGVTTKTFGEICCGIIRSGDFRSGIHHLIPADTVSKFNLVNLIAAATNRNDLIIKEYEAPVEINRDLTTINPEINNLLWRNAGYDEVLSIYEMIAKVNV